MSLQTLKVLGAFFSAPREELSGADIARTTKLATGSLYPILLRLEDAGWLTSSWESESPHELGRPRRRYYRLTALGAARAKAAYAELPLRMGRLAWV